MEVNNIELVFGLISLFYGLLIAWVFYQFISYTINKIVHKFNSNTVKYRPISKLKDKD